MDRQKSAAEELRAHVEALGQERGTLYHHLESEVIWLHAKWIEYRKLFAKTDKRIELLNYTGSFFFSVVQQVFWEDMLLHIARLTDPPKQQSYENLTLLRLSEAFKATPIQNNVRKMVGTVVESAKFARNWRNRHIAHRELALAVDPRAEPLEGVSREDVESVLASMRNLLNLIREAYLGSHVGFQNPVAINDADSVICHLNRSVWIEERTQKRLEAGIYRAEDMEHPPEV